MVRNTIIAMFRSLLVGAAFITWGIIVGIAWGAEWGTATAGKIALLFGTLSFVYGAAEFRSVKRRAKRSSRK
jgi:hypothetical protein